MKMLKARLYERAVAEREAKKAEVDKQKGDIAFGVNSLLRVPALHHGE